MRKRGSLRWYRTVDLFLFALMLLLFESVIIVASIKWFPGQPYTVSVVPALVAILIIRWGPCAAIHALLGGILVCVLSGAKSSQYVIYCVGNLFPLLLLPFLSRWRRDEGSIKKNVYALALGLAVLLLIQIGRAVVSLFFGFTPVQALGYFTTDVITDLFTLIVLWIVRRLDGMLEDQAHYLNRIRDEEKT